MASVTFSKNGVNVIGTTFTPADFTGGTWHSDEVTTQNLDRVTVNVVYSGLTPDGKTTDVDFRLQAVLEGQEDDGSWLPLVHQFTPHFTSDNANTRRLIATSKPTSYDPDFEHGIPDALGNEAIGVTVGDVDIPDKIRMCLVLADRNSSPPKAALTSVVISMTGQLV